MQSRFEPVALAHACRLINHGPTVLVTSRHGETRNIMAAAWSMPVEFSPPRIAIVIDKATFSRELIAASGHFGVCIPAASFDGPVLGVPLIEDGAAAWMECRLIPEAHTEDAYDTCFAEVVSAAADPLAFSGGHWQFSEANASLHTLHHLGAGNFVVAGKVISAAKPASVDV